MVKFRLIIGQNQSSTIQTVNLVNDTSRLTISVWIDANHHKLLRTIKLLSFKKGNSLRVSRKRNACIHQRLHGQNPCILIRRSTQLNIVSCKISQFLNRRHDTPYLLHDCFLHYFHRNLFPKSICYLHQEVQAWIITPTFQTRNVRFLRAYQFCQMLLRHSLRFSHFLQLAHHILSGRSQFTQYTILLFSNRAML